MKRFLQNWGIFICIILVASFFRLYQLDKIPVGLHGDEASVGYNAYSLLKTAHDQNGNFLPIAIDQFGDFRPAGYHYIDIPFVALLGLNITSTRLPAALFGIGCVIVFYFLLLELFNRKSIALVGSFLLAVSPWHIVISRATSEGVIAAFFVLLGTLFFFHSFKKTKYSFWHLGLGFLCYIVSFLFYHSARLFAPIFVVFLFPIAYYHFKLSKKLILIATGCFVILLVGLFFLLTVGKGSYRATDVSILNIPGGSQELKQAMDEEGNQNPLITRFLHNKFYFYSRLFAIEYYQHFGGEFLFVNNGNPVRYKVWWTGNLYPIEAPFLLLGFAFLLSAALKEKKILYFIPLAWLFLGPIPAGLTWEDIPNVQRASLMIYGLAMIGSFGFIEAVNLFKKNWLRGLFLTAIILFFIQNISYFSNNYFYHSPLQEPWYRSASEPEVVFDVVNNLPKYDRVEMTTQNNNNFIFYLYYTQFDPKKFQQLGSPKEKDNLHFGKLVYLYASCPLEGTPNQNKIDKDKVLYVDKPDCQLPKNAVVLNTINTPDGAPSFKIVTLGPAVSDTLPH